MNKSGKSKGSLFRSASGSLTLEAALVLPLFLVFVLAMHALIRLSIAEVKVQAAASETVKEIATHYAPVDRLYSKAKQKAAGTRTAEVIGQVLDQIRKARGAVTQAEESAATYESIIPDSILSLLEWEKKRREQWEAEGQSMGEDVVRTCVDPVLNGAFQPIVWHYADKRVLQKEQFRVTKVTLPDLNRAGEPWFGVEVEYRVRLPLPFVSKTIVIRKKAMERAWVGNR
ncbi:TadE family protein [Gorillibacterium sp. CAU 1737]|uniref:TadE/TadG family type IV pilus assembly protein n=1 Tax=Gorillibacterium sp. CAU 1737 TaxID=3140362 RepID=UPI00326124AB